MTRKAQNTTPPTDRPTTRKLVIIRGRGTPNEQRIQTRIDLYLDRATGLWMTIPENGQ